MNRQHDIRIWIRPAVKCTPGGFTLVELTVAITISAIFLVASALVVGSLTQQSAHSQLEQMARNDVTLTMATLRSDIGTAGIGFPIDLATAGFLVNSQQENDLRAMYQLSIRDVDSNAGPDELLLGGIGVQSGWVSSVIGAVEAFGANTIDLFATDLTDEAPNFSAGKYWLDPRMPVAGSPPLRLQVVNRRGWVYGKPREVQAISQHPSDSSKIRITYDGGSPLILSGPATGDLVLFYRDVYNGVALVEPETVPMARWYLEQPDGAGTPGRLMRQIIYFDPDNLGAPLTPAQTASPVMMLDDVVDFQVAFLVWPCGGEPQWVDHLLGGSATALSGEFGDGTDSGSYANGNTDSAVANRYLALRERLISVRTTILLRSRHGRSTDDATFQSGQVSDLLLENHLNLAADLDSNATYFTFQASADPINIRIKAMSGLTANVLAVRDVGTDAATRDPTGTFCTGAT